MWCPGKVVFQCTSTPHTSALYYTFNYVRIHLVTLPLIVQYKAMAYGNLTRLSSPCESLACETNYGVSELEWIILLIVSTGKL